jgi:ferredoxin--NADP+ reductase
MRPLIHGFIKDKTGISNLINVNVDSTMDFVYKKELDKLICVDYKNYWLESRKEFYEQLDQISKNTNAIYYVVGGDTFIIDVIKYLKNNGINENSIVIDKKEELFANYFI